MGRSLVGHLFNNAGVSRFSPATSAQIKLSEKVGEQLRNKGTRLLEDIEWKDKPCLVCRLLNRRNFIRKNVLRNAKVEIRGIDFRRIGIREDWFETNVFTKPQPECVS